MRAWTSQEIEDLAAEMRAGYATSGDVRLAKAAAALDPPPPHRPPIDDAPALERMAVLSEENPDLRPYTVARLVARELGKNDRATAVRLFEKFKRAQGTVEYSEKSGTFLSE